MRDFSERSRKFFSHSEHVKIVFYYYSLCFSRFQNFPQTFFQLVSRVLQHFPSSPISIRTSDRRMDSSSSLRFLSSTPSILHVICVDVLHFMYAAVTKSIQKEARTTQEALERKLVYLAVKKARCLAERVASDSVLFSHLIDEAVAFENELKG